MRLTTSIVFILLSSLSSPSIAGRLKHLVDVKGNAAIREVRVLYHPDEAPFRLERGKSMFAEVDFVPRYIPPLTYYLAVSAVLPTRIRAQQNGSPWLLGWYQTFFSLPKCPICQSDQVYTLPVTLLLHDDGWCAEGPTPTVWKVEAIAINDRHDGTDMVIGMAMDDRSQIEIVNSNTSTVCKDRHEVIG